MTPSNSAPPPLFSPGLSLSCGTQPGKSNPKTKSYTRAYINHLGRAGELLGGMLVSQHNVFFMNELMTSIRRAIREGSLEEEEKKWLAPGLRSRDFHRTAPDASSDDAMAGAAGEGYEETED